ncbi:alpha/beta fold hydrolase, partial [Nocardia sp. NPDC050697]|uniref:alpha/beta fold hydrolase n=1 Tax=Nocardia sp. NPDC050697 TaxID=3155158 RepID=UPI0033E17DBE
PTVVAARLDQTALKAQARTTGLAPIWRQVITLRRTAQPLKENSDFRTRFMYAEKEKRRGIVLELVLYNARNILRNYELNGPDVNFIDSGFDSLTAMEMRNALIEATGLKLSPMTVFDHSTAGALTRYILAGLEDTGRVEDGWCSKNAPAAKPEQAGPNEQTLPDLYRNAVLAGRTDEGGDLLYAAACLRARYKESDEDEIPSSVLHSDGPESIDLIFICTPAVTGGVHQQIGMGAAFQSRRRVISIPLSGFKNGEPLPDDATVALDSLADMVISTAGDRRFVLAGYSSGGLIASAVASYLKSDQDIEAAGVILLDSFSPTIDWPKDLVPQILRMIYETEESFDGFDSARLTAMAWWTRLIHEFVLDTHESKTLFLQCGKPKFYTESSEFRRPTPIMARPWLESQELRVIDADHFSMIGEDSSEVVSAIDAWLSQLPARLT